MKLSKRAQSVLCKFSNAGVAAPHAIIAVVAYAAQNPGLEYGNYASGWNDKAGRSAYFAESRQISKDWRKVAASVSPWHSVTDDDVIEAAKRTFSGRLNVKRADDGRISIDYCTGQYWPTEYRKACAAVLEFASTLAFRRKQAAEQQAA